MISRVGWVKTPILSNYIKKEKTYFYELLMAIGDSHEKIIRFYFPMKYSESIFFKKIS